MRILATDLDRTLLPNGTAPDDGMLTKLGALLEQAGVELIYVTARRVDNVIAEVFDRFDPPRPTAIIGAVGGELYRLVEGDYVQDMAWQEAIATASPHWHRARLESELRVVRPLRMQPREEQTEFKISYFIDKYDSIDAIGKVVKTMLLPYEKEITVTVSHDLNAQIGYCDITPKIVTKAHALEFLLKDRGEVMENLLVAGDSQNDRSLFLLPCDGVMVANALPSLAVAFRAAKENGSLLSATGLAGLNGNYASGVVEGLVRKGWLTEEQVIAQLR